MSLTDTLTIPPLVAGGIMLTYRCTNACAHCLYRCGPKLPDHWMDLETAERTLAALAREPHLDSIHLAGGEATLNMDLLVDVIGLARRHRVPGAYLETNAHWCTSDKAARDGFERLREAGLDCVLVSASMFHNAFIPFERTRRAVETASEIFGPGGVIVWLPQLYRALSQMPPDRTHTLAEFCETFGLGSDSKRLPDLYNLTPGGRVVDSLRAHYSHHPAEAYAGRACRRDLLGTTHFHIDPYGNLFTGLCAGISAATADDLHPRITPETHPVFTTLCESGPGGLLALAEREFDYRRRDDGYISRCDLCFHVRRCLAASGQFAELRPESYY